LRGTIIQNSREIKPLINNEGGLSYTTIIAAQKKTQNKIKMREKVLWGWNWKNRQSF